MQIISQVKLVLRAYVFRHPAARAELALNRLVDARHRCEKALTRVENRAMALTKDYWRHPLSEERLRDKALRLATRKVLLTEALQSDAIDIPTHPNSAQRARSFESILLGIRQASTVDADTRAKDCLERLLSLESLRDTGRRLLADAWWAGELDDYDEFATQIDALAHGEVSRSGEAGPAETQLAATRGILASLSEARPARASATLACRAALLDAFSRQIEYHARVADPLASGPVTPVAQTPPRMPPAPAVQLSPSLRALAGRLDGLSRQYWENGLTDVPSLRNAVDAVVSQSVPASPQARWLPEELRYRHHLEALEYVRGQQPRACTGSPDGLRLRFESMAAAIERTSLNDLIGRAKPPAAPPAVPQFPESAEATDASDNDSAKWSDGESDVDSVDTPAVPPSTRQAAKRPVPPTAGAAPYRHAAPQRAVFHDDLQHAPPWWAAARPRTSLRDDVAAAC